MSGSYLMSTRSVILQLSIPCQLSAVRPAIMAAGEFLREQGVDTGEVQSGELALTEACNNAVQHSVYSNSSLPIELEVICGPSFVEFRVSDRTLGFDWPETVELPNADQESGRGLFIIQALMGAVNYLKGKEKNVLVMRMERQVSGIVPCNFPEQEFARNEQRSSESEQIIQDMADELSFCYESLSAIFRCSAELGRASNLKDFGQRLLTDLSRITGADWFVLRLVDKKQDELTVSTASHLKFEQMAGAIPLRSKLGVASSFEAQAALSKHDVWFDCANPLQCEDPLGAVGPEAIGFVHPVCLEGDVLGTIAVGRLNGQTQFTAVHANVVHTFADFLAVQIANVHFQEEQFSARLVSRELEIAHEIQASLLPKELPQLPGFQIAGFCQNARQVGGDFYDVIQINPTSSLLIIADVMGKGIPAAIFAVIFRSLVRAMPEWNSQPATLLTRLNRLLYHELSGVAMFITAQLAFVDAAEGKVVIASAGHCPLLMLEENGGVKALAPEGLPLGILPNATFSTHTEKLSKSCPMLLYTDGLTDARNSRGELFGQDRLLRWFKQSARSIPRAEELKENLAAELRRFQGGTLPCDDQTFLIVAE